MAALLEKPVLRGGLTGIWRVCRPRLGPGFMLRIAVVPLRMRFRFGEMDSMKSQGTVRHVSATGGLPLRSRNNLRNPRNVHPIANEFDARAVLNANLFLGQPAPDDRE